MKNIMRSVGSSYPRSDAAEKVTGSALYPGDIDLPNQAWAKIVFAGIPHARINAVDITDAAAAPGVVTVLTAADVPINEYGLIVPDQPVLCGVNSNELARYVRWEADQVAVVVAETAHQAESAAKLIQIDYTPLPVITDPIVAMQPDAPQIHPNQNSDTHNNILHEYTLKCGNVANAFSKADVIVESSYQTHPQEHAYLQPEAGLAFMRADGRIEVIVGGQWMHEDQEQIAHAMGLPADQIVVRYPSIGGAFGGREDMSIQIVLALAAQKTGRPIKIVWSREESIIGHHKRHAYLFNAKWGATTDGKIVAAEVELIADAGGYAYTSTKVLGNALMMCLGPYEIPNVHVNAKAVYTNNCPGGAFRGFGAPQGHFAAEGQVNKLARALQMDPVELRMRNVLRDGSKLSTRSIVPPGCTAAEVLAEAAQRGGWQQTESNGWALHKQRGNAKNEIPFTLEQPQIQRLMHTSLDASQTRIARGQGIAVSLKNVGFSLGFPEHCHAWVELHGGVEIERAIVGCVGAEVGQGAHMAFKQMAAEMLDLSVDQIELRAADTDDAGSSGSASASRLTFMAGNAIQGAADKALQQWTQEERPARGEHVHHPRPTSMYSATDDEVADPHITFGYCAQLAEVAVDLETGHVTVTRLVSVNDVGKAVNPQLVEGQIEGGVVQAIGWSLYENYLQKEGKTITPHLSNYLIPGILDVAEVVEPVILEIPDPQGPLGIRGMAEMPMIPTAPAIAAAIENAIGVWIDTLPFTPERVWQALRDKHK